MKRRYFLKANARKSIFGAVASRNRTAVASAFADRESFFVLVNYRRSALEVTYRQAYAPIGDAGVSATEKCNFATSSLPILLVKPV